MTLTQVTKAGLDSLALDHVFTIGASGTDHYTFQGEGLNGTVNDPTLYLTRGKTYRFENGSGGHPIRIQSTSGASGTAYNTGVTNNAGSGTVIVEVQHDAPDVLYYQCTSHANMNGILYITGALADGGVTTAKLAADAVDGTKLADNAVAEEHIAADAVDEANLKVSNTPTNGYFLSAQSGNTGGLTWAQVAQPDLTNLSASNLTSGTVPDARFPATLPAVSGANLTNLPAATSTSGTNNFTIADGNLIIGTSGHGIDFSATADATGTNVSMSNELLDDYEYGEWDPKPSSSYTDFTWHHGRYVKVGRLVLATFRIDIPSGWSGNAQITNLPFDNAESQGGINLGSVGYGSNNRGGDLTFAMNATTTISLSKTNGGNLNYSDIDGTGMRGGVLYVASS
tara:strand:- start:374 stop:1567 length:1194 start_codon:yes stop_codon:yes gene_type:complete